MTREKKFDSVAKSSAIAVFEDELKIRSNVYAEYIAHGGKADCGEEFYLDALDMAIDALREQDALLAEIKGMCHLCRHYNHGIGYKPCDNCDGGNNFEWRGAQAVTDGHQLETVTNCNGLNGWISVEDELPEDLPENNGRKVIPCIVALKSCYPNGKATIQKRQRQVTYDYDYNPNGWEWSRIGKSRVTHWMPLPESPEVEV